MLKQFFQDIVEEVHIIVTSSNEYQICNTAKGLHMRSDVLYFCSTSLAFLFVNETNEIQVHYYSNGFLRANILTLGENYIATPYNSFSKIPYLLNEEMFFQYSTLFDLLDSDIEDFKMMYDFYKIVLEHFTRELQNECRKNPY